MDYLVQVTSMIKLNKWIIIFILFLLFRGNRLYIFNKLSEFRFKLCHIVVLALGLINEVQM